MTKRHSFGPTVVIQVGIGTRVRDFHVHQDLICDQSPFFRAALNGNWKESKERKVKLPEDDPVAFELYSNWLYHNTLISNGGSEFVFMTGKCLLLGKAYVLGDKLGDLEFMDFVVDGLIDILKIRSVYAIILAKTAYEHTPLSSPLRRLSIDVYRFEGKEYWLDPKFGERNEDMLWDLASALMAQKSGTGNYVSEPPYLTNTCLYHQHAKSGKPCYKTKKA